MKSDSQADVIADLKQRKQRSREFLRTMTPAEKIAKFVRLQEQYYKMLQAREESGGRAVPERWRRWHLARYEGALK